MKELGTISGSKRLASERHTNEFMYYMLKGMPSVADNVINWYQLVNHFYELDFTEFNKTTLVRRLRYDPKALELILTASMLGAFGFSVSPILRWIMSDEDCQLGLEIYISVVQKFSLHSSNELRKISHADTPTPVQRNSSPRSENAGQGPSPSYPEYGVSPFLAMDNHM
jgi:hypothetical protein